ncbi:hypothetical protein C8F04DRAFT_938930, partial [Mycena alexandri]
WAKTVYPEISAVNLGDSFNAVLRLWIRLESEYKWASGGRGIGKNSRPGQVLDWIKIARGGRKKKGETGPGVTIKSLAVFEREWWTWWGTLQPMWRVKDAGRPGRFNRDAYPSATKENWATLLHPGQNGVLTVVATLYWWGLEVQGKKAEKEDVESWAAAVTEVKWMLRGLAESKLAGT